MTNDDHADWINPNDIKNALGLNSADPLPNDWKNKLDDLKKRPTQEDLNNAVKKAEDNYKDYINPKNPGDKAKLEQAAKDAGFINPSELESEAKKKGMVSKGEYDKVVGERNARPNITLTEHERLKNNQEKHPDYDAIKNELERWRKLGSTPEQVDKNIKDLQSRPVTGGAVLSPDQQQKLNDYSKIEKQKVWLLKYLKEIRSSGQYAQIEQQVNNIK